MAGTGFTPESDEPMAQIVKTKDVLGRDPRIEGHRIDVFAIYQRQSSTSIVVGGYHPSR